MRIDEIYEQYQRAQNYNIANFVPEPEKLSAIVITKNEEKNIARCLASLEFAEEVIVVDSGSQDKTIEIAESFKNVTVIQTQWFGFVENKKIALSHTKNDWVFWIDADEVAPASLAQEWKDRVDVGTFHETGAIAFPRKTFFLGHWVQHSGWYPGYVTRIFHKKRAVFSDNILHESLQVKRGFLVENFKTDLLHYSYTSMYQYFDKMNKYGLDGAKEIVRRKKFTILPQLMFQPFWTFFKFYILKKGFLDGRIGLIICMGAAFSNFIKYANFFFLKKYGYLEIKQEEEN